ncbi:cupin domain-containing protein [Sphingomonas fennica]|uniref:Cupin domain-containing protein n=1 Tax=Edaphosphingomonas fennica TaxID=114404 RepID=A0A2T4I4C0_9SPHN|nr:cupin domain-containing protein [Sphingomonas fennica]PTD24215.1 cupin domain-containing protein [Sphingomonas fennica]
MIRRIVTGNDAQGRSYIVSDERVVGVEGAPDGVVWRESGRLERWLPSTARHLEPDGGSSRCSRVVLPPWAAMKGDVAAGRFPGLDADGFHRTETIDYILMLEGEVDLVLDRDRTTIRAGDVVIQRNASHAWQNMTDRDAVFWGVMTARAG